MIEFSILPAAFVPAFIFFARIIDVSIGTIRIMFVSKGYKLESALLGFIEILIWIIVIAQIFQNLDNWLNYVAYAGGFASGVYIGMFIEERMKKGVQLFRIIPLKDSEVLFEKLKESGFRVVAVDGVGKPGPVKIIFTIAKRSRWQELAGLIALHAPDSFYSAEDIRFTSELEENPVVKPDMMTRMLKLKKGI